MSITLNLYSVKVKWRGPEEKQAPSPSLNLVGFVVPKDDVHGSFVEAI